MEMPAITNIYRIRNIQSTVPRKFMSVAFWFYNIF